MDSVVLKQNSVRSRCGLSAAVFVCVLLAISGLALGQWQTPVRLSDSLNSSESPFNNSWAVTGSGQYVHAVWSDRRNGNDDVFYKRSTNRGMSWSSDVPLVTGSARAFHPVVAAAGTNVYVAWFDNRSGEMVYVVRSTDYGQTWLSEASIGTYYNEGYFPPCIVATGNAVYLAFAAGPGHNVYCCRSTNGGSTWSSNQYIGYGFLPSLAVAGDTVHLTFFDGFGQYYVRSTNAGATWGTSVSLGGENSGCIAASGSNVYVFYGRNTDPDIRMRRSTDGGSTWRGDTGVVNSSGRANWVNAMASGTAVHLAWADTRTGPSQVFYRRSTDCGATWGPDTNVSNSGYDATYPNAAADGGTVYLIWSDSREGTSTETYFSRNPTGNPWPDVGCLSLVRPTGTVDSGSAVTPACTLYNFGSTTESYRVRMRIGTGYNDTARVTSHAPGTARYVTFANWTAGGRGTYSVRCSTELTGDQNNANDRKVDSVMVRVADVGVTAIAAPAGNVDSGTVITPACSVCNWGTGAASCSVRMKIGATYNEAAYIPAQPPGTRAYVTFPSWTALTRGSNAVRCSTELATDMKPGNDKASGLVNVKVTDVAVTRLVAPAGSVDSGTVVIPACSLFNFGTTTVSGCSIMCSITGPLDWPTVKVFRPDDLYPGTAAYVEFPGWTASPCGKFDVRCSVQVFGDQVAANDQQTGQVVVVPKAPPPGGGWSAKTPMPTGIKPIADGGWLEYDANKGRIFAARGNKQADFYAYAPLGDSWGARMSWPRGRENKPPSKGAAGCADGNGAVYATKGNNTLGFWKYYADGDSWQQKADVPLGTTNKRVKGGTDLVFAYNGSVGSPYLLKGYKNEFYCYDVAGDSWKALSPAPTGRNIKWDKGSWLAYDDVSKKIYAFKSKYHEFYRYSPDGDSWSAALDPMPLLSSLGSHKAKDGSCGAFMDDNIYALKGGNTIEFWQYSIAGNTWTEKETIPSVAPGERKKVKAGAGIAAVGDVLYATKGNKSNSLWAYSKDGLLFDAPRQDGVAAKRTELAPEDMRLSPNPIASGFAVLHYGLPQAGTAELSVYDVTGQRVMVQLLAAGRSGANLDLRHLSNGVYLVKLSSRDFTGSRKLVVQRQDALGR